MQVRERAICGGRRVQVRERAIFGGRRVLLGQVRERAEAREPALALLLADTLPEAPPTTHHTVEGRKRIRESEFHSNKTL